jgi:hypothetical protein
MTDPAFRSRLRKTLDERLMPEWTAEAACRSAELPGGNGPNRPGVVWDDAFKDELPLRPDPDDYAWPVGVRDFMRTCSACPVRSDCLEYAFTITEDRRQFGVYGGVPGRIREDVGFDPCGDCTDGYCATATLDGRIIGYPDYAWVYTRSRTLADGSTEDYLSQPGFTCPTCGGTGRIVRTDGPQRCAEWFTRYAHQQGWDTPHPLDASGSIDL